MQDNTSVRFVNTNNINKNQQSSLKISTETINLITGIFLLILAVSGNFIAETLGCKSQKLLSENMYVKNMIIILIIYFSLGLTNEDNSIAPHEMMKTSLSIWIFFLIFNKMSLPFTITSFLLISIILIIKNYKDYYEAKDKKKNRDKIIQLKNIASKIFILNLLVIIVGFILYFRKQYSEHSSDFSFISFIFGKAQCQSMK
jgi:hypothetical protein